MGKQHIIELNGKRYDTITGKMIAHAPAIKKSLAKLAQIKAPKMIDGFARPARAQLSGTASRKVEKSKTLMRTIVHKPAPPKAKSKPKVSAQISAAKTVLPSRLAHAQAVTKNALVRRFGGEIMTPTKKQPAIPAVVIGRPAPVATAKTVKNSAVVNGLARATSHEQPRLKKLAARGRLANWLHVSQRSISLAVACAVVLVLASFLVYQNLPNIAMRVAAARSGVHGTVPGYQPAGFDISSRISYKPGQIVINYQSVSDNRRFSVTQSTSGWDSETLHDNLVRVQNIASPTTIPDNGKTIYVWDSNAAWVDAGILYKIEGDSKLNSDQLLRLANSL